MLEGYVEGGGGHFQNGGCLKTKAQYGILRLPPFSGRSSMDYVDLYMYL